MLSEIVIGVMCAIVIAAGIFGWWLENGGTSDDPEKDGDEKRN